MYGKRVGLFSTCPPTYSYTFASERKSHAKEHTMDDIRLCNPVGPVGGAANTSRIGKWEFEGFVFGMLLTMSLAVFSEVGLWRLILNDVSSL